MSCGPNHYHGGSRSSGWAKGNQKSHNSRSEKSENNISKEKGSIMFQRHYDRQNQTGSTFSTIKDHILNEIQKNYKYGFDITEAFWLEEDKETVEDTRNVRKR